MMKLIKLIIVILLCVAGQSSFSQSDCFNNKVLEPSEIYPLTPLPQIRLNDLMWHRRLWREIDVTEKINQLLYFPNAKEERSCSFYDFVIGSINKGYIKAYGVENDAFTNELTPEKLIYITGDSVLVDGKLTYKPLDSRDVVKYWLKEDWFFDANYSKIEVRILGICAVKIKKDINGNILGYQQLFWLYYPHIRATLNNQEAFKKVKEDDPRVSYDDIFVKRLFNSSIMLKEGEKLLEVKQNKTELDIKLENEKTKSYYFNNNTKLWGN